MTHAADIDALLGLTLPRAESEAAAETEGKPQWRFADISADGPEFQRIMNAPRRPVPSVEGPEVQELCDFLFERMALVPEPYPGRLRPRQALAIKEGWEARGGVFSIKVGGGKSATAALLPSVLIPSVVPAGSKALLITKAAMVGDATKYNNRMRTDWRMLPASHFPIVSYERLSTPSSGELLADDGRVIRKSLLARIAPKILILDEAHCAGDAGSAVSKRINAYLVANPDVLVFVMTGTLFKNSIKDAQRLMEWALKDRCPLPCDFEEREAWASYLDARAVGRRVGVGDLVQFLDDEARAAFEAEEDYECKRSIMRRGIAQRMFETPGFIGSIDPPLEGVGLKIDYIYPDYESEGVAEAFRMLRGSRNEEDGEPPWRLPDGSYIPDGIQAAAKGCQEGLSFWNKFDPPPPEEYRFALSQWNKWCSRMLRYNKMGIDSEFRCKDAVKRGLFDDRYTNGEAELAGPLAVAGESRLALWEAADAAFRKDTGLNEPPTVAQWLGDEVVDTVGRWVKSHPGGLVWVDSVGLGERLSKELGIPYYRQGGLDARKRKITDHPRGQAAVASLKACGTGKNLQHSFSKNLWLCQTNEQALGRTHRDGQTAACVQNWVYLGCYEHLKAFYAARNTKATFQEDMQLNPQKLRYAEVTMPTGPELEARGDGDQSRWSKPFAPKKS